MNAEQQLAPGQINGGMSPLNQMYDGRSVFITGASGFIGRVLLEKLLRSYQGIERVYILMRAKKSMQPAERLNSQVLNAPIFDRIRSMANGQALLEKIKVVTGDIGEERLGLSGEHLKEMLEDRTLSIVFHSAATVKFDEPLKTSINFNLRATQALIELCRQLPNLIALCHVSTAYVNSDIKNNELIEETLYPIRQTPHQVLRMSELLDDDMMALVKPLLVGERPNTYTLTKALAEHLVALEASDLPVAMVRPSIVIAAWKEPLPGWVDNLNGPTGLILAIGKGLLRSMHTSRPVKAEVIPVDIVVNTMIAASFYAAKTSGKFESTGGQDGRGAAEKMESSHECVAAARVPPIFHCTSGELNPITWGDMEDLFFPIIRKYPSHQVLRYPFGTFKSNKYHDTVTRWFVHILPALVIDLICLIMGKKRQMLSVYFKLHSAISALSHFTSTNYNFKSANIKKLQAIVMHPVDKEQLYMDISPIDWYHFWDAYVLGARRYVLKEEDSTLNESRRKFRKALYLEYALRTFLLMFVLYFAAPSAIRMALHLPKVMLSLFPV